mmetsp:Transcript_31376/g.93896  ORF Transcript_31376/g.93896 Transcript_31376/m.93896 type:complete len:209 (-) Transcript_31376:36-662(-)
MESDMVMVDKQQEQAVRDRAIWSDNIRTGDFLPWLEENHRAQLRPDTYQRAQDHCVKLLDGRGVPKTPLTPRRRFCGGVPLRSLRLDWNKIESSALDVANLYGGPAAADGGLLWCVRRLRLYSDAEHKVRIRGRRECFYEFLCATQDEGGEVGTLGEQQDVMRLIADFVGIRAPVVCSDAACKCVFSSCKVKPKSKVRGRKWQLVSKK